MKTKELKVREGRTELIVPHENKKLTYVYSDRNEKSYSNLYNDLERDGLSFPVAKEAVSLIYSALHSPEEKYSKRVLDATLKKRLVTQTFSRYFPGKGVFIWDNYEALKPKVEDNWPKMNLNELESQLTSCEDGIFYNRKKTIRFVPGDFFHFGTSKFKKKANYDLKMLERAEGLYKRFLSGERLWDHDAWDLQNFFSRFERPTSHLEEDKFAIALVGKDGAKKLKEISEIFEKGCYISHKNLQRSAYATGWNEIVKYSKEDITKLSKTELDYHNSNRQPRMYNKINSILMPTITTVTISPVHEKEKYLAVSTSLGPSSISEYSYTFGIDRTK